MATVDLRVDGRSTPFIPDGREEKKNGRVAIKATMRVERRQRRDL